MKLSRLTLILLPIFASACSSTPKTTVFVPVQETAQKQYAYADNQRSQKDLMLRDTRDMDRLARTREEVRQVYIKVVEYFPTDREVTPLARLQLAEMKAGLDPKWAPSNRELRSAVKDLQAVRTEYPEHEFAQAKSLYDEAMCMKSLGKFKEAQQLFKEVGDRYRANKNDVIKRIASLSDFQYNQTYVKK